MARFGLVGLAAGWKDLCMPRSVRNLSENSKEILSMKVGGYIFARFGLVGLAA